MRTRGAVEDLVVVDLDDPDEIAGRGPAAQRRHFEDHYAELPFGLGTVPRRLDHTPWYARPGVVAWVFLALIGLLAVTSSGESADDESAQQGLPVLTAPTGARLILQHNDDSVVLDVDRASVRPVAPNDIEQVGRFGRFRRFPELAAPPGGRTITSGQRTVVWMSYRCQTCRVSVTDVETGRTRRLPRADAGAEYLASVSPRDRAVAFAAYAGPGAWTIRTIDLGTGEIHATQVATDRPLLTWSRNGRWLFVAAGIDLIAIDPATGTSGRVDIALPPFEGFGASF